MPGGYDFAFRSFADGIGAQGYFYRAPAYNVEPQDGRGLVQVWKDGLRTAREDIAARIRLVLPGDPGGIAAALTVSDRRGISRETVDVLRATGLAHILAISGLHMALAAGILYIGVRKALAVFPALVEALPVKKIAAIGALMTATAYLMISGGSVSTQRAWVMLTVMLVAVLVDRLSADDAQCRACGNRDHPDLTLRSRWPGLPDVVCRNRGADIRLCRHCPSAP
ncbi:ComEC/Rec2 family competence protein [Hoeflea alexandrii]|uniref:ComEC/Rec2 family competence protein n=1 Tax=Hoeflea alexandrii TaxID=288436 RepID=UPI0022715C29|nr:ComEC/Rec2 family competence protein [Hoeflea alexandrii]MCY0153322.1 ComEC/Rec2 family competence protein [Hoeflea alexandrii]